MEVKEIKGSGRLVLESVAGSHLYGLNRPSSDLDHLGIFALPRREIDVFPAKDVPEEISQKSPDFKFFELRKFFRLMQNCSPQAVELLFAPDSAYTYTTNVWLGLRAFRSHLVTQRAVRACIGFHDKQVGKATGQNKRVMQPQSREPPRREDFCTIIPADAMSCWTLAADPGLFIREAIAENRFPMRPVPLTSKVEDLKECHAARLEGTQSSYRLYWYGNEAKGVFRSGQLVCESIPKEDEWDRFVGQLIWNRTGYEEAKRKWKEYWEWMKERNPTRWEGQDGEQFRYDRKNMEHAIRILQMGKSILDKGKPDILVPEGPDKDTLMDIIEGLPTYQEIMEISSSLKDELLTRLPTCGLPKEPDMVAVSQFYEVARDLVEFGIEEIKD